MQDVLKRESDYAYFERRKKYIYVRHKDYINIDLDAAKIHAQILLALCNGYRYPVILDGRSLAADINHEAREFIARYEPVLRVRSAQAILINTTQSRLLANFYIKFHPPKHPVKIFSNLEDAEKWVSQFNIEKAE